MPVAPVSQFPDGTELEMIPRADFLRLVKFVCRRNETASESAKSSDGSTLSVIYGKGSSVEGHLLAYDKGTIMMAPTDGATLTLTGNLYAYGEDASVGSDFGNITRISRRTLRQPFRAGQFPLRSVTAPFLRGKPIRGF